MVCPQWRTPKSPRFAFPTVPLTDLPQLQLAEMDDPGFEGSFTKNSLSSITYSPS